MFKPAEQPMIDSKLQFAVAELLKAAELLLLSRPV